MSVIDWFQECKQNQEENFQTHHLEITLYTNKVLFVLFHLQMLLLFRFLFFYYSQHIPYFVVPVRHQTCSKKQIFTILKM
jgi:hypothetical protein